MIRVLIVDDSETERMLIKRILQPESDIMIVGVAKNGREALELNASLHPDVITMDIQMPVMDGLEATRLIMSQHPTPIVIISSTVSDESVQATLDILEAGALVALAKPINVLSPTFESTRKHIVETLRSMSTIIVAKKRIKSPQIEKTTPGHQKHRTKNYDLVAVGVSVGGPSALKKIFTGLNADFPLPIVLVQHMNVGFITGYAKWLDNITGLTVKVASHLETLEAGTVYIAPDSHHMTVEKVLGKYHAKLIEGQAVDGFYPSITVLLKSVAASCGKRAVGVLLTGMGRDGADGLLDIKRAQGHTFIQDAKSALVFGMAGVAQSLGAVDKVVDLDNISKYLNDIT